MNKIIKTALSTVTLVNPAVYVQANTSDTYYKLFFYNTTGNDIKVKINNSTDYSTLPDKGYYDSGVATLENLWKDEVTIAGTGDVSIIESTVAYL